MPQIRYANLIPLGKLSITAAGTPTPLSANCGPLGGQVISQANPLPVPGTAIQQFTIQAASTNAGNLFLLPRGNTAAGNPAAIMAIIPAGASIPFPSGLTGPGLLPENLVLDTDATTLPAIAYGYGVLVG